MRYMICYDITDSRKRAQVRNTLRGYGDRVQYSVFECALSEGGTGELRGKLEEIIDRGSDSVRFYPLCSACCDRLLVEGSWSETPDEGFVIV